MLEFEEYKTKLNNLKPALDDLGEALQLAEAEREIATQYLPFLKDDQRISNSPSLVLNTKLPSET